MNAVVVDNSVDQRSVPVAQPTMNPVQMIALAVQQGLPLETLQVLRQMQKEWEADEARKAFVAAMAAFKANPPEILKDKHVEYTTNKGTTAYDHATLGSLCAAIIKGLAMHSISHRWETAQQEDRIKVTCVLTHAQGHSESVSLHASADDSGGKNRIQAIGSAVTYLQRYTLLAATGLAALDQDDDGKGSEPVKYITESQLTDLKALGEEVKADKDKFLAYLGVKALSEIPAKDYIKAVRALEAKRRQ